MRPRELIFGAIGALLLIGYAILGASVCAIVGPAGGPTPTPAAVTTPKPAPMVPGTITFTMRGDVFVMKGGSYGPLTFEGRNQQPSLSGDGRTVVFSRRETIDGKRLVDGVLVNANIGYSSIVSKPAIGGTETTLVNGLRGRQPQSGFHDVSWFLAPALSPDGRRLAFLEDDGGGASDLVLMDMTTRLRTPLTNGADLEDVAWSPDGRQIATTVYDGTAATIVLWSADRATEASRVRGLPDGDAYRGTFSPDGRWLVYTLRRDGRNDVHIVELATRRDVALTSDGQSWNGVLSPDGRWLAFFRERGGTLDLYAMELGDALTGGAPKEPLRLTGGEGIDGASRPWWGG